MTIVGTRPEIIRLSRVMKKLDAYTHHLLVHTGQNYDYELNEIFFRDLELRKPDIFLNAAGASASETTGNTIAKLDPMLTDHQPDAVLILGDTNSCLASIPAKKRKIPVFHMEAGNRCFDMRVPEEINRRIVDHISDINLTYSDHARSNLQREGLPNDRIIKTGSPMYEVLQYFRPKIESCDVLNRMELAAKDYFLVSAHREENVDSPLNLNNLINILNYLGDKFQVPVIVSTHPRTRKSFHNANASFSKWVQLMKPLGFFDYVNLQMNARVVLSDSGTISEESSILRFPAINLREAHERPEAMDEAAVMMTGMSLDRVCQAIEILKDQKYIGEARTVSQVQDYLVPNVSDKVLRIILKSIIHHQFNTYFYNFASNIWWTHDFMM